VPADQVLEFAVLYRQNCAGCHGTDGKLGPAPPLNDALFRGIVPETELESIITQGRNKTLMPGFGRENGGTLTAAQIQVLVHEIKGIPYTIVAIPDGGMARVEVASGGGGISPKWGSPGEPPAGVPSYVQQTTDANDSAAGKKVVETSVFGRACAACHGDYGQGIARGDAVIQTINDPVFLSLCSDQVLRRYVITGRPDLGMPGFAEARPGSPHFQPLTDREVTGLVALLASWRETTAKGE
jgi:cytochrome c oxidase cbb3-type subunit 3/ubiquinol-cytochrome c reductase cytochrome c subunit